VRSLGGDVARSSERVRRGLLEAKEMNMLLLL
jgi:hypothetical protein